MRDYIPIVIDGEELYISGIQDDGYDSISIRSISSSALKHLLKPISRIGQAFRSGLVSMEPDEVEMTMQFTIGVDNDKLFLGLATLSTEAQIGVKFLWKSGGKKNQNVVEDLEGNSPCDTDEESK